MKIKRRDHHLHRPLQNHVLLHLHRPHQNLLLEADTEKEEEVEKEDTEEEVEAVAHHSFIKEAELEHLRPLPLLLEEQVSLFFL